MKAKSIVTIKEILEQRVKSASKIRNGVAGQWNDRTGKENVR